MPKIQKDYAGEVLTKAKDYYNKIKPIYDNMGYSQSYQLGMYWEPNRDLLSIIHSGASAAETIGLIHNTHRYSVNPPGRIKENMVDWYIACLMQSGHDIFNFDAAIQESPISGNSVERNGRLLTPDFLRTVAIYLEIQKYCSLPKSKLHIVELGEGCGHLARTFKLFMPNNIYVDIDLPETLYFAYIFLRLNFPHAKTCYVTDPSQLKDGIQRYDFVFVPTMFAEYIPQDEFDLFCNTASLGEMTNPVIRYWMHFVQNQLRVQYFYGLNTYLKPFNYFVSFDRRRLNENECSVLFDAKWRILRWELEPLFVRCPYEEASAAPRYLEIIAERLPDISVNEGENRLRSEQIIEDLMDEDWIRRRDTYTDAALRCNVLANDLTMSGTLFKLWESIRLDTNKTNVALMLEYLHTLAKLDYPFEEWFYYKNLLRSLVSKNSTSQRRTTLAEGGNNDLWKHALALPALYNPFSIRVWCYRIIDYFPSFVRSPLLKLYRALLKIRQSNTRRLSDWNAPH